MVCIGRRRFVSISFQANDGLKPSVSIPTHLGALIVHVDAKAAPKC